MKRILFVLISIVEAAGFSYSQSRIVDEIVSIVGDKKILYSDIENQYHQLLAQGYKDSKDLKCMILEQLLIQKLMVNQAAIDSIVVTEAQVEMQLDQRMQYFINQIGSEEKLEDYFNKTILEIKEDNRDAIREQLITDMMRREITKYNSVTPSEVKSFYKSLPVDSIPYINAQVEIDQIVLYPPSSEQAILNVRERLLNLRQRIIDGENFSTLAVLYSEGPSAPKGGDIGWSNKGDLDPEYAKVASSLKVGQVSKIVETSFGYHIIQLIDRTGDRIHTRHILLKPKITIEEKQKARDKLDSLVTLIRLDSLKFKEAARLFSMDKETRMNGGQLVNPNTGNTKFELDQFDTKDYVVINKLSLGEISEPYESVDSKGKTIFKIVKLKSRSNPHVANLKDDYTLFKQFAMQQKENEIIEEWIKNKIKTTFIKIDDKYKDCNFNIKTWLK